MIGARGTTISVNTSSNLGLRSGIAPLAEMVRRGTVWVPTIDHNRYYIDAKDEYGFAPETIPPLQAYVEKNLESTRRAVNRR